MKTTQALPFPIVALGGSAGSLEAIRLFFCKIPSDPGFAFVVHQHLDPHFKSLLPELMRRWVPLKVRAARNGMAVKPGIAPKKWTIKSEFPATEIVGLSMYVRSNVEEEMLTAGASLYLTKDAGEEAILSALGQCLQNKESK